MRANTCMLERPHRLSVTELALVQYRARQQYE